MCIMLSADIRIFELGAGRTGADGAIKALGAIAIWSQTPAARRACLHAAQIFGIMSHQWSSDSTMFHSHAALFAAALVLSLYVFTCPSHGVAEYANINKGFDLLNKIDWERVGDEGMAGDNPSTGDPDYAAVSFIRNSGPISMAGVICRRGCYQSCQRILLNFADLLQKITKWKWSEYPRILRNMSDILMDIEPPDINGHYDKRQPDRNNKLPSADRQD
jgi:hypothetical protein